MQRIHFIVRGVVQGVGFRYFCAREAERLKLTGYTRNLKDGTVEVEAQGGEHLLQAFANSLQKGPRQSRVEQLETEVRDILPNEQQFVIL